MQGGEAETQGAVCSSCGVVSPRSEMFGIEPEVLCGRCADGVRLRYAKVRGDRPKLRPPVVTAFAIAVAALLYVLVHFVKSSPPWLDRLVAGEEIWDGEVWRLVTTAFFHANLIHILFNVWWMWDLGRGIEGAWGPLPVTLLIVGGAGVASAMEWVVNGPGIGLSGVVYALAGFLYALRKIHPVAAALMNQRNANVLIVWFVVCIILTMNGTWAIANWAHGGGAVWGYLAGVATGSRRRRILVPAVALLTIAIVAATPHVAFGKQAERRAFWQQLSRR